MVGDSKNIQKMLEFDDWQEEKKLEIVAKNWTSIGDGSDVKYKQLRFDANYGEIEDFTKALGFQHRDALLVILAHAVINVVSEFS
jgi:cupin superfamily acireductone dioxygenase involved in methionine salvage